MNYLLLTVVRDEAQHLPQVIEAIQKQTQPPELWLIIDDGSRDGTNEILATVKEKWIVAKRCHDRPRKSLMHYSQLLSKYAEYVSKLAIKRGLSWEALATVDGDSVPEPEYFATLAMALEKDEKLGIISGEIVEHRTKKNTNLRRGIPWGAALIYRRECLKAIGGISPTPSHNSVEIIQAKARNWHTKIIENIHFEHIRPMGSNGGWYRGHAELGRAARWLGLPVTFALAKALNFTLSRHPVRGLGYLIGYFSWNGGNCQIPEVKAAYHSRWLEWWKPKKK